MMDKTIRRVTDPHGEGKDEQQRETYRYWQSRSVGERLIAVCELSESAYAFHRLSSGRPQGALDVEVLSTAATQKPSQR